MLNLQISSNKLSFSWTKNYEPEVTQVMIEATSSDQHLTHSYFLTFLAPPFPASVGQQPAVGVPAVEGVARLPQVPARDQHLAQKALPQMEGKKLNLTLFPVNSRGHRQIDLKF